MNEPTPISDPAWLIVAGAEQAAIYRYEGPKEKLIEHHTLSQTLPKNSDITSDQPGRNKNQQMPGGETFAEPTEPRTHQKKEFAKEIADYLYKHHQQYDRLVIAAAPKILGMLRDDLHTEVQNRLKAEVDKNLSQYDENELPAHLEDELKFDTASFGFDDPRAHKFTPDGSKTINRKQ